MDVQLARCRPRWAAPVIARSRVRAGNTASARGRRERPGRRWSGPTRPTSGGRSSAPRSEDTWTPMLVSARGVRRGRATVGLRRRGRRDRLHRVHRPPQRRARRLPAGRAAGQTTSAVRCRRWLANSTLSAVEADQRTATTPSSNKSSPSSKTDLWPTCLRPVPGLGGLRGDRIQPRLHRRGRRRPGQGPLGQSPVEDHQGSGQDRQHRTPADPASAHRVALGFRLKSVVDGRDRTIRPRDLATQPHAGATKDPVEEPDRPATPPRPHPGGPVARITPVDQGSGVGRNVTRSGSGNAGHLKPYFRRRRESELDYPQDT